ncbi:hypothetical protein M441DRAFT_224005 [Trichoderma asperellum CBS 433.97]|uniref:Uncharacterized protein n=1 Tax=Trichoderma asperellum (strain ATCC 204424 / CBS 433.97 / NBRC 101777) TaxID=1042311 RepID=A0A2T3ZPN2_TRIA4|nr:hypothetical protein M441DRAFT_224005 [Trichoderma asperellum CBS 433.97]PTB46770.1 hypothetical protein M441DRAFT_224005 [Trichoderma asperellum CBS 433.97]
MPRAQHTVRAACISPGCPSPPLAQAASLMHGVQVASRIGEGQRWSYASETTMSIPERPIGYAIPPTTCRQSHPRRVPADLLSTRNHLLASSIAPGKKISRNYGANNSQHSQQLITYQAPYTVEASLPTSAIARQPLPTTRHYRWSQMQAICAYLYISTHTEYSYIYPETV